MDINGNTDGDLIIDGNLDMNGFKINELGDPTLNQDAATKKYVDDTGATQTLQTVYDNSTPARIQMDNKSLEILKIGGSSILDIDSANDSINIGGFNTTIFNNGITRVGEFYPLSNQYDIGGVSEPFRKLYLSEQILFDVSKGGTGTMICGEGNIGNLFTTGDNNILLGWNVAPIATTLTASILIGRSSGLYMGTGTYNTTLGANTLGPYTPAGVFNNDYCTAIGYAAAGNANSCEKNTCIGYAAGLTPTTSNNCVFLGCAADGIAAANNQIAIGCDAKTTVANSCTIGNNSLTSINPNAGNSSCSLGGIKSFKSLFLESGSNNVLISTLSAPTAGDNICIGDSAGLALTGSVANNNVHIGVEAGQTNTGYGNTTVGRGAGSSITNTSGQNTMLGLFSGQHASDIHNTYIGSLAGRGVTGVSTGNYNTGLGSSAGNGLTTGSQNVMLGALSTCSITGNNQIALGYGATTTVGNSCVIGDTRITSINPMVGNTACSLGEITPFKNISITERFRNTGLGTTAINALSGAVAGDMIYNTDTNMYNYYNGSAWGAHGMMMGEVYYSPNATATVITTGSTFTRIFGTVTDGVGTAFGANGASTYAELKVNVINTIGNIGHFGITLSYSCASNNQTLLFGVYKNATFNANQEVSGGTRILGAETKITTKTATENSSSAIHFMDIPAQNDVYTFVVQNTTSTANVTMEYMNFFSVI